MFQSVIRSLKQKDLFTPSLFLLALLIVLSLIIILGQFFHQSLQEEMADQFNKQQLLLAHEVSMNIDTFVDHVYRDLRVISHLPEVAQINRSPRSRAVVEAINFNLQNVVLVTIRVLDKRGIVLYDSAYPGREGVDLSNTDYFRKTQTLPKNEKLISDLLQNHDQNPSTQEFIIATPIYEKRSGATAAAFSGVALAVLSMDGLTQKYLAPIKSGMRGYAWMMDSSGTLLYHPNQPQMVGKNLYHTDATCAQCHKSFDTEKKMIEGKTESFGSYEAPGGENKLAAYYRIPMTDKSWLVVVSAPYSDVIALMQKSMRFYSLLIVSIFLTTLVASGATVVTYKKKIKAEEKAMYLENHRRLEREIEISKDYLENIVENTKMNLMVLDQNLIVKTLNTAQAITLGRRKDQVLGKSFFSLFPDSLESYDGIPIEAIFQRTMNGRSFEIKDYRISGIQPDPVYFAMTISPLLIDGKHPGILITSNDVTKRVQLEEALKQYTVELEDKVDQGTATAKKLEQQMLHSEKLAALGRLAAGVAHEIGNPLTSISTFAQLLREMATDEFSRNSLDIINNHIQRITEIVRQMSTYSRPDSLNIKSVQINEVLNASIDLMRLDKRMKNTIEISVDASPDLPKTMIDEGQISQVFINIFLNALDAMPDGGKLRVATRVGKDDQDRDAIIIEFADSGIGIPREDMQKIFDPFYTTKEAGKGTGLGLALSYNLVKKFKGDIKVESELGKGTTFTVVLPIDHE